MRGGGATDMEVDGGNVQKAGKSGTAGQFQVGPGSGVRNGINFTLRQRQKT